MQADFRNMRAGIFGCLIFAGRAHAQKSKACHVILQKTANLELVIFVKHQRYSVLAFARIVFAHTLRNIQKFEVIAVVASEVEKHVFFVDQKAQDQILIFSNGASVALCCNR